MFYDFEKDIKVEEIIFIMRIKKEDKLCFFYEEGMFELCEVSLIRPYVIKVREGRSQLRGLVVGF
jgi:putative hemolysin